MARAIAILVLALEVLASRALIPPLLSPAAARFRVRGSDGGGDDNHGHHRQADNQPRQPMMGLPRIPPALSTALRPILAEVAFGPASFSRRGPLTVRTGYIALAVATLVEQDFPFAAVIIFARPITQLLDLDEWAALPLILVMSQVLPL